jgi:hypothetical protein
LEIGSSILPPPLLPFLPIPLMLLESCRGKRERRSRSIYSPIKISS